MSTPALHAIKHRGEFIYPIQVWYFTLSVLAVGFIANIVGTAWTKLAPRFHNRNAPTVRGAASISRVPAAVLTAWRIVAFRWRFPLGGTTGASVFEVFAVCIYMSALLIWEFVHTNNLDPDFWSNKAAHIMAAQLSILPALSAKNNILGYLLGVGYERLNIIHRAFGRCLYVFVWIHVFGRWRIGFTGPDYIPDFPWQQVGAVAGVTYTIAVILSLRPIRKWSYEIFYYTHCVLIIVLLIAACIHTTTPGFNYYVYPVWVVWGFERIVRGLRYFVLNVLCLPRSGNPATAELVVIAPNTLRVTLARRMPLGWRAGQHAFINFPSVSTTYFESHPFSIASIPERSEGDADELVFYIKARTGATRRMVQLATLKPSVRVNANIDGPYGRPTDLKPYRTSILIAGGTGVSYILPLLLDIVKHASSFDARTARVHFIWATRSMAFVSSIAPTLKKALASRPASLDVQVSIYITSADDAYSDKDSSVLPDVGFSPTQGETDVGKAPSPSHSHDKSELELELGVIPVQGRPDLRTIVREEITRGEGPLAIEVSGPHTLVEDARAEVSHLLPAVKDVLRGGPTVNFHAETFAY